MRSVDIGKKRTLKGYQDLDVWKSAHKLVLKIYKLTRSYPAEEKYGLTSQMRRAVISIPANIVEGFRKRGIKDKQNFYNIAQASLDELSYYVILSKDLGYIQDNCDITNHIEEIARMLSGLIRSTEGRK